MTPSKSKYQSKLSILLAMAVIAGMFGLSLLALTPQDAAAQGPDDLPPWTDNQIAADGPLSGDVTLYQQEVTCQNEIETPGYYAGLGAQEIADAQRSALFPCFNFLGSFDGPNEVFAWRSADYYQGAAFVVNRMPGEMYLLGGVNPPLTGTVPAGPYLSKLNATTGDEMWRTYFENANASGAWIGGTNLNILPNGNIVQSWSNKIALVDGDTGLILNATTLPTGDAPANNANFKHLTIAPDGTIIVKDQTRPIGLDMQGTGAIIAGNIMGGFEQPNSIIHAVDPETLEVLDSIQLPEPSTVPHIITEYDGKIAIYVGLDTTGRRYFWDPVAQELAADDSWVVTVTVDGQTTPDAPTVIGDWIAFQTNGLGSPTTASSIVVVNQQDPTRMETIFPFGELQPGQRSFAPPKPNADPDNNMIYSADAGVGKVAGISIDQETGALETVWVVDNTTNTFQPLIGPSDQRIILLTNQGTQANGEPGEQQTWRNAATGEIIAESDFFEPLTFNSLVNVGYGGRVYFPTDNGFLVLQAMPARDDPPGAPIDE
ncbi:MAG: hypothetical protein KDJ65_08685 [Anaerolineae bacterium]|nr:hypothetical protein [Anaerolineae bacterium]